MSVVYVSRDEIASVVASKVSDVEVVLDIGPGIRLQPFVKPSVHICVDAHRPYLEHVQQSAREDPRFVFINSTWDVALPMLLSKSVDSVFAIDVIEHMEKETGLEMLREAERVARQQIVIFTPLGFFPQSYDDPNKPDRWGMNGGYWQTHRSGWELEDFNDNWDIVCCKDFHLVGEDEQPLETPMGAFWAVRTLGSAPRAEIVTGHSLPQDDSTIAHFKAILRRTLPPPAYGGLRSIWHTARRAIS